MLPVEVLVVAQGVLALPSSYQTRTVVVLHNGPHCLSVLKTPDRALHWQRRYDSSFACVETQSWDRNLASLECLALRTLQPRLLTLQG